MSEEINQVRSLLRQESTTGPCAFKDIRGRTFIVEATQATVMPILHNEGKIILQFDGWSINLADNGTWIWEDTTGG